MPTFKHRISPAPIKTLRVMNNRWILLWKIYRPDNTRKLWEIWKNVRLICSTIRHSRCLFMAKRGKMPLKGTIGLDIQTRRNTMQKCFCILAMIHQITMSTVNLSMLLFHATANLKVRQAGIAMKSLSSSLILRSSKLFSIVQIIIIHLNLRYRGDRRALHIGFVEIRGWIEFNLYLLELRIPAKALRFLTANYGLMSCASPTWMIRAVGRIKSMRT